jgi:glyoxylase-like metal-dependent hydrolase (beta-lactamase superfamily II)
VRILNSDRREFLSALVGGAAGLSFSWRAFGQAPPTPIQVTKLTDNLVLISGDGGNIAVLLGEDGLFMVDGGYAERSGELLSKVSGLDSHPIRLLFDTHWHVDHVGANVALGRAGVKIMANENVKKWLSQKVTMEAFNRTFDPLPAEGLPTVPFTKGGALMFGKTVVQYTHVETAHTDSDAFLFFPRQNVIHTGDLFFNGFYPVIDYSTGGWIGGMAAGADAILKVGDAKTRVIPGHGPLASKDDLKATRDMLETIHQRLEPMYKDGRSVDETIAAAPTKDFDEKWAKGTMTPAVFTRVAYTSIQRHYAAVQNQKG